MGLKVGLHHCIHSILLDSGRKYDRYLAISYLPKKEDLPSCLAIGNLEVSKEDDKEFFNPCKFYDPEILYEAVVHILSTYIAFEAVKRGIPLYQTFIKTIRRLQNDKSLHKTMIDLAERYYQAMKKAEGDV